MKIKFWGATDDVTGSMTLVELPEGKILIDCGLAQGTEEVEKINLIPLPFSPKELKAVIITHAHLDHSGYLPRLVKKGFKGPIFCTPATSKLMRIILMDSAKLNENDFYEEEDVKAALAQVTSCEWREDFNIAGGLVRLLPAGHILGASSVLIEANHQRVVFSGDLGRRDDPLLPPLPPCPKADFIIMESTYGGKIRETSIDADLAQFLDTIHRDSRVGIIASFAVARAQTLLTLIHQYFDKHPKKKSRLVIDSPMMKEANKVYQQYAHLTLQKKDVYEALDEVDAIEFQREWESLKKQTGPLIVLSSSGMLTGGRIGRYLEHWQDDEEAILFLPGYQGEGTPGRRFTEGQRTLLGRDGKSFQWQGQVWFSEAFSSHADQADLLAWVRKNNQKAKIFLLHGEEKAKEALKKELHEFEVMIPSRGHERELS